MTVKIVTVIADSCQLLTVIQLFTVLFLIIVPSKVRALLGALSTFSFAFFFSSTNKFYNENCYCFLRPGLMHYNLVCSMVCVISLVSLMEYLFMTYSTLG